MKNYRFELILKYSECFEKGLYSSTLNQTLSYNPLILHMVTVFVMRGSITLFLMDVVWTLFRPNLVLFAIVRACPALVLSINISRFHSSRTPMSFIIIRPELDTVSKPFFTSLTPIFVRSF